MSVLMNYKILIRTYLLFLAFVCISPFSMAFEGAQAEEDEPEKGPHRGRMLRQGDFALELSIFETGVPPEFRVWAFENGNSISPEEVDLQVTLVRLGDVQDKHQFKPQGDVLRGDSVYEPHSFVVQVQADYQGKQYQWQYDNFEGRTTIEPEVARALEIKTEIAGPATIKESIKVYGQLQPLPSGQRVLKARFEGMIKNVFVNLGQTVKKGERLLTVESNESLKPYDITAPINGVVTSINAQPFEQTQNRRLVTLLNSDKLNAELAVFPSDISKVRVGALVTATLQNQEHTITGKITQIDKQVQSDQSVLVRAEIDNSKQQFNAGLFVTAQILIDEHPVDLAVKRAGLQSFRDFTVVYAKVGNEYEVRMLELGRSDTEWIEVLGGLKPGTEYVSKNSYILKADIEKSGASHDH